MKIAVFVSGGGTNLQAIIDNTKTGILQDIEIVLVLSSSPDAYALTRAADNGIKSVVLRSADFADKAEWDQKVVEEVKASGAELVVLAGYLSLLGPKIVSEYSNRIINIHPALIPSFCGKGYYGLHVHEKVLERGAKVTGATVHFVDEDLDHGPILLQKAVDVKEGDTPQILQRRVMEEAERILLPRAISLIARGRVTIDDNGLTHISDE